jgi:type II secretory pathway component PulF
MLQKEMQFMVKAKNNFQIIAATISTLYFSVFAYGVFIIIQQFESVFDSFATELPIQTSLLMGSYRYWGILGALSVRLPVALII